MHRATPHFTSQSHVSLESETGYLPFHKDHINFCSWNEPGKTVEITNKCTVFFHSILLNKILLRLAFSLLEFQEFAAEPFGGKDIYSIDLKLETMKTIKNCITHFQISIFRSVAPLWGSVFYSQCAGSLGPTTAG